MSQNSYVYLPRFDRYLTPFGALYSDEMLDYLYKLEQDHIKSFPRYTFKDWLEIFPGATKEAKKGQKNLIKQYKKKLVKINEEQQKHYEEVILKADFREQADLQKEADILFNTIRSRYEKAIKRHTFNLSLIEGNNIKKSGAGVEESDILKAKQVPIESLFEFNSTTVCCPFHNEKTPSFKIYRDQNTWWCYGECGTGGSSIDFIMKRDSVDFLSAVKTLLE